MPKVEDDSGHIMNYVLGMHQARLEHWYGMMVIVGTTKPEQQAAHILDVVQRELFWDQTLPMKDTTPTSVKSSEIKARKLVVNYQQPYNRECEWCMRGYHSITANQW